MEYNYRPLGDRVVVEILKRHDEKTKGGLFTQSGVSIPMSTKVGDIVLLDGTGFKHKNGGKTYNIYRESEFLSILDEV